MVSVASRVCNMLRCLLVGVWNGSTTFSFRERYPRMLYVLFWLSRSQVVDTGRRTPLTSLTSMTTVCNSTQRPDFQERSPQRQQAIRRPKSSIATSQQLKSVWRILEVLRGACSLGVSSSIFERILLMSHGTYGTNIPSSFGGKDI